MQTLLDARSDKVVEYRGFLKNKKTLQVSLPTYPDCKAINPVVDSKSGIFSFQLPQMAGKMPYQITLHSEGDSLVIDEFVTAYPSLAVSKQRELGTLVASEKAES